MVVRPGLRPAADAGKAPPVQLAGEGGELGLLEVLAHELGGEAALLVDEKSSSVRQPPDDVVVALVVEQLHEALGEGEGDLLVELGARGIRSSIGGGGWPVNLLALLGIAASSSVGVAAAIAAGRLVLLRRKCSLDGGLEGTAGRRRRRDIDGLGALGSDRRGTLGAGGRIISVGGLPVVQTPEGRGGLLQNLGMVVKLRSLFLLLRVGAGDVRRCGGGGGSGLLLLLVHDVLLGGRHGLDMFCVCIGLMSRKGRR